MIQRCRAVFPIRLMCRCLRVSASGYYGWATRRPSARRTENARLVRRMRELHTEHDGVLGSPRMWEELRYAGEQCGRHRVARLMRPGRFARRPAATALADQAFGHAAGRHAQSGRTGLHGHGAQYQRGD